MMAIMGWHLANGSNGNPSMHYYLVMSHVKTTHLQALCNEIQDRLEDKCLN